MRTGSQTPLLIAVAGLSPRAGTTTTTVALARTWPGPEAALVVEADPAGGQLADMVGADPHLGSSSLARRTIPGEPISPDLLAQHVQFLPGGEALLAAPPGHDAESAALVVELLTGPHAIWRGTGVTVFADCGVGEPDSLPHPVFAAADACLLVVRADHIDPETAEQRILALTRRRRPRGIVLIGADRDYATAIGLPVLGTLPATRAGARALLLGRRARRHLTSPARPITTAVDLQLRGEGHRERPAQPLTRHVGRPERPRRRTDSEPRIYRIDQPSPARPPTPEPVAAEHLVASARPPALESEVEDAGRPGEDDLAAAPETSPDNAAPEPDSPALSVFVFGATRILWRAPGSGEQVDITSQLQPRSRELVALLALHPEGLSRSRVIELIWGGQSPERSAALSNTLSRLRASITTATRGHVTSVLIDDRLHCRLSANAASVDYWDFLAAVAARRHAGSDTDRSAACRAITSIATTDLAADLTGSWTEPLRESARRDTHNALDWLATHDADHDPRTTLGLLEQTVETDPYNETVWRDILRQHALLGEYAALARTYTLLTRRLSEIGESPSRETRQLLEQLRRGEDRNPPKTGT
ncbi:BTAD domain-containing putative transcriptional regulator [Nocardia brevicatena]|uniref:BTAD domain-containing putative transcriptional regulator n=1 Tax=Nocardia brevicatena TaxID=37327 RepID=UPI0002D870CD|nr:BTAD domain-containing putative transcriptional regulator [Nocardia brevicatena]